MTIYRKTNVPFIIMNLCDISSIQTFIEIELYKKNQQYKKNCYYNEFFTPFELIEKMLSHIPDHLWNLQTKWLEPTCGQGYFLFVIFNKLFHHENCKMIPEEERMRVILANLYANDINPENVAFVKQWFNVSEENFLDYPETKFDVIIGNPPFHSPIEVNGKIRKNKNICEKIIEKCMGMLNPGGHLCFISPTTIWSGKGVRPGLYEKMLQYYPKYIYLDNLKKKWFNVGQNLKMCYFVLSNEERQLTTIETTSTFSTFLEDRINPVEEWTEENEQLLRKYLSSRTNGFKRTTEKDRIASEKLGTWNGEKKGEICVYQNPQRFFFVDLEEPEEKYVLFRMKPFDCGIRERCLLSSQIYFLPLTNYSTEEKEKISRFFHSDVYQTLVRITTTSQYLKSGLVCYLNFDKIDT